MLENIREGAQGLTAKIILGLVILTFALAGVGSYTNIADNSAADVNGEKISRQDFEQAFQAQRNRMQQQFGEMFETLAADTTYMANFRQNVLDQLINEKLIDQAAEKLAIRISDEQLKTTIRNMQEFQVDGVFDNNRYLAIINQAGFFQASDFRDYMRVELIKRQLSQAVVNSEFSAPYQAQLAAKLNGQTRDLRYVTINSSAFVDKVTVDDSEVEQYYQLNSAKFSTPEKAKVNYLVLDMASIAAKIEVSEQDLQTSYQSNLDSYKSEEQRKAAHILIEFGDDESAAKAKIEAIEQQLAAGSDFAEIAKSESSDTFSAENGGDLDWFVRGVMDPEFESAAFSLTNKGDVSAIVKSAFGFHIIKLLDIKPESIKSFDEVKDVLLEKVKNEKAQTEFYHLQQKLAEVSFESPDSLDAAADAVGLTIVESDWLTRLGNSTPFNSPKVLDVVFSEAVIKDNVNSDIIEISTDVVMVVHVKAYEESKTKPIADVESEIKTILVTEKSQQLAKEEANSLLTKLVAGDDITSQLTSLNVSFSDAAQTTRTSTSISNVIVRQAFKLPHPTTENLSATVVELNNGDVALVHLLNVNEVELDASVDQSNNQQQTSQLAQSAYRSFVETLKSQATIKKSIGNVAPNS